MREEKRENISHTTGGEYCGEIICLTCLSVLGAVKFYETSALHLIGVDDAMMGALRAALCDRGSVQRGRRAFRWPWR